MTVINVSKESNYESSVKGYPVGSVFEIDNGIYILAMIESSANILVSLVSMEDGNRWSKSMAYPYRYLTESEINSLACGFDWHLVESINITYKLA